MSTPEDAYKKNVNQSLVSIESIRQYKEFLSNTSKHRKKLKFCQIVRSVSEIDSMRLCVCVCGLNDDKKNKWNFSKSKHSKNFKNSFEHTNS
jgi:hypothetical protein